MSSKISTYLGSLTSNQLRKLSLFIHSPYHCSHHPTQHLFNLLSRPPMLSDPQLYARIYPESDYDNGRLRVLRANLVKLVKKFLVIEQIEQDKVRQNMILLEALESHQLYAEQERVIENGLKEIGEAWSISSAYTSATLLKAKFDLFLKIGNRSSSLPFAQLFDSMDTAYLSDRLKYLCSLASGKEIIPLNDSLEQKSHWTHLLSENIKQQQPIVQIYHQIFLLFSDQSQDYQSVLDLVHQGEKRIGKGDLTNIYGFLMNYFNRSYMHGDKAFLPLMLRTYQKMLNRGLIFDQETHSAHHFKNICMLGARLEEFDWTEQFIESHQDRLPQEVRIGLYHYCHGLIAFARGSFSTAKKHLLKADFLDAHYRATHNLLLIRVYYLSEDDRPFANLCHTLNQFTRRNKKLGQTYKDSVLNFIGFVRRLQSLRTGIPAVGSHQALLIEISQCSPLMDKQWLIDELQKISPTL